MYSLLGMRMLTFSRYRFLSKPLFIMGTILVPNLLLAQPVIRVEESQSVGIQNLNLSPTVKIKKSVAKPNTSTKNPGTGKKETLNTNTITQKSLEQNTRWKAMYATIEQMAASKDAELKAMPLMPSCDAGQPNKLLLEKSQFEDETNYIFPQIFSLDKNAAMFDVNSLDFLQKQELPTNATLNTLLPAHEVMRFLSASVPRDSRGTELLKNVSSNISAWVIPKNLAALKIQSDAAIISSFADLREQSLKAITNYTYFLNEPDLERRAQFIKASMTLYARNKMLCLYGP